MMDTLSPKMSIVIPIHNMKGGAEFLWRSIDMITRQTFKDFEIIIVQEGKMAENTNAGIKRARGQLIKILYLDDYLSNENVLEDVVIHFRPEDDWMILGASNNKNPYYTDDIERGNNKLGSPSALVIRNYDHLLFDENLSWLLDCDYYKRAFMKWGQPRIRPGNYITIGEGKHQMSHLLSQEVKEKEFNYLIKKYA